FPAQMALSQGNNYEGPIGVTGIFNGNISTGCSYDPLTHSEHREVTDIVVPGSIGKYPLKMKRYYNSRQQYYAGTAIGLGPGWAQSIRGFCIPQVKRLFLLMAMSTISTVVRPLVCRRVGMMAFKVHIPTVAHGVSLTV